MQTSTKKLCNMLAASCLTAILMVCAVQARSPYSASDLSAGQLNQLSSLGPFNQYNEDLNSQLNGEEDSLHRQANRNQYAREDLDDIEEATDDDGSDGTENLPMRNYAPPRSAASSSVGSSDVESDPSDMSSLDETAGEDSDASELAPSKNNQRSKGHQLPEERQHFGSSSPSSAPVGGSRQQRSEVEADQRWANRDIDQDADLDAENEAAASAPEEEQSVEGESEQLGMDTNIANAKIDMTPRDMSTAAGHHYHGHSVHGMLKMGAETGKKGAFKWYDKHPVGGKGR